MEQHYTPSGKYSPLAFVLWIIAALTALPLLAGIYAYAIWYIPIPYLNFAITGVFGYLIGLIVSNLVLKIGKVRNGKWAFLFCLFGALTALYIHWAVWVDLAFNITDIVGSDDIGIATSNIKITEVISLLLQPSQLFSIMGDINEVGVWGIKGGTVSGGFLTFIWVVELLMATLIALVIGMDQSSKPFCEKENKWFEENELTPVAHFEDGPAFAKALSSGDKDIIESALKSVGDIKKEHHAKMTLYDAKSGENFVSIQNEIAKTNDKGEISFETQHITSYLKISQEVADILKKNS